VCACSVCFSRSLNKCFIGLNAQQHRATAHNLNNGTAVDTIAVAVVAVVAVVAAAAVVVVVVVVAAGVVVAAAAAAAIVAEVLGFTIIPSMGCGDGGSVVVKAAAAVVRLRMAVARTMGTMAWCWNGSKKNCIK
jgi:hypothetical protein